MKRNLFAAAGMLLLSLCTLTGCGQSSSEHVYTEEQLPYGATIIEENTGVLPVIAYDSRFLDSALIGKIRTYYRSIQACDGDAFGALMFPLYHNYQLEEVYGGKFTDAQIVQTTYDNIKTYFNFDFDYTYIDITGCITEEGWSANRDGLIMMLDELAEQKGEKKVSEDTQAVYELTVTRYVDKKDAGTDHETEYVMQDETLYAIQYQNEWYLMYA